MKIVVAFDGTEGARDALGVAAEIVAATRGELVVCWVLNPLVDAAGVVAPTTAAAMSEVEARASATVDEALSGVDATATVRLETVTRGEDVAERLARIAAEEGAALLAIASRRAVGMRGALMGSVAQETLRLSPCPVLVVRPDHR